MVSRKNRTRIFRIWQEHWDLEIGEAARGLKARRKESNAEARRPTSGLESDRPPWVNKNQLNFSLSVG